MAKKYQPRCSKEQASALLVQNGPHVGTSVQPSEAVRNTKRCKQRMCWQNAQQHAPSHQ